MKALTWHGKHDVRVDTVDDPTIVNPRDAIIRITATAICGSDLHLYNGVIPTMQPGDILGHEFMGVVEDVGAESTLAKGDRVVVPFTISCGHCFFCEKQQFAACDNSNPAETHGPSEMMFGHHAGGLFGYSHMTGGYAGGQAEYVRVPFSDVGPIKVPDHLTDEQVLFLSDILPTGWMAALNADIEPGDTVAVWGCGPVGLFAIQSAKVLGAEQIVAIDHHPHRLELATQFGAIPLNYEQVDVLDELRAITAGIGPDAVIDAVGMESHGFANFALFDKVKQRVGIGADAPAALRQAITACRKGGRISMPGVYGGYADKFPLGALMEKGLQLKTGQTNVQAYTADLLKRIENGEVDTTFLISHRLPLSEAPDGYRNFRDNQNEWTKVVLKP